MSDDKIIEMYHNLVAIDKNISAERIREALNSWHVDKLADEYYRFNGLQNKDLIDILSALGIEIPQKLYRIGELKHIKQTITFSM